MILRYLWKRKSKKKLINIYYGYSNLTYNEKNLQLAMDRIINELNKIKTTIHNTDIFESKIFIYRDNE